MKIDEYGRAYIEDNIPPEAIGPDGKIIPIRQRESLRQQVAERAAQESAAIKRQRDESKTEISRRVELFENRLRDAKAAGDKTMARMLEVELNKIRPQRQEEIRRADFDADPRVQATLTKRQELIDSGRSDFDGAWEVDLQTTIATADSRHNFESPEQYLRAFNESVEKIGRDSMIHKQQVASAAEVAAAEANLAAARAQIAAKEAESRLQGQL